jgi:hypothetical protein
VNPLAFDWLCQRDDGKPCFGAAGRGNVNGATWTIPAGTLETGAAHTFSVTVSKGEWRPTRFGGGWRARQAAGWGNMGELLLRQLALTGVPLSPLCHPCMAQKDQHCLN